MMKIKTEKQLLSEGWTHVNVRSNNIGLCLDLGKGTRRQGRLRGRRTGGLFVEDFAFKHILGKTAAIIATRMHGNPEFQVQIDDYTTWLPWQLFTCGVSTKGPEIVVTPNNIKTKIIDGHQAEHYLDKKFFKFDYITKISHKRALQMARWIAKELGYILIMRKK